MLVGGLWALGISPSVLNTKKPDVVKFSNFSNEIENAQLRKSNKKFAPPMVYPDVTPQKCNYSPMGGKRGRHQPDSKPTREAITSKHKSQ